MRLDRREFLRISALAAAVTSLGGAPAAVEKRNDMPNRELGKTREPVSLLCLGGAHIGLKSLTDEESIAIQRAAIDAGVNFLDNAAIYNGGRSEGSWAGPSATVPGQGLSDDQDVYRGTRRRRGAETWKRACGACRRTVLTCGRCTRSPETPRAAVGV